MPPAVIPMYLGLWTGAQLQESAHGISGPTDGSVVQGSAAVTVRVEHGSMANALNEFDGLLGILIRKAQLCELAVAHRDCRRCERCGGNYTGQSRTCSAA